MYVLPAKRYQKQILFCSKMSPVTDIYDIIKWICSWGTVEPDDSQPRGRAPLKGMWDKSEVLCVD